MNNYANRGKSLEDLINYINSMYQSRNIALIHKVPTEWSYSHGRYFPKRKSIVDFLGIARGRAIAFDTKETKNKTNFSLGNIHKHQMDYLRQFDKLGGLAFYLIHFKSHNELYILYQTQLDEFMAISTRKSIPYLWFISNAIKVDLSKIDYLSYLEV